MRRCITGWFSLLLMISFVLLLSCPVLAVEISTGDSVNLPSGTIKGPLFISGNNITVNADVTGDVFAAGSSISINGNVTGDVLAAGNTIRIGGNVSGDVRAAGNMVDIVGKVGGSATGAGQTISIPQGAIIGKDALLFGNTANISGSIQGQVLGAAGTTFDLNGPVGSDVRLWGVQQLNLGPNAVISGSVTYNSANQATVSTSARTGQLTRLEPPVRPERNVNMPRHNDFSWGGTIFMWIAGLLIWGAITLLFPRFMPRLSQVLAGTPMASLGWGFLALLVIPLGVILFMITIIGLPLAMILLFVYILILSLSKLLVADSLSHYLTQKYGWQKSGAHFLTLALVFLAFLILGRIPVAGFVITLIIGSWALGIIIMTITGHRGADRLPPDAEPVS